MKLRMNAGTDQVCHGPVGYTVSNIDWVVDVPPEVAAVLLRTGAGAVQIDAEPAPEPEGELCVKHVSGMAASFSWRGRSFVADDNGVLVIPAAAIGDAISHGFTTA
jgi:hypothetical protein